MLRFVGWYYQHRIRLHQNGDCWTIQFEPIRVVFVNDSGEEQARGEIPWQDDATYRTEEEAKETAQTLAQKMIHETLRDPREWRQIEWRDLSE